MDLGLRGRAAAVAAASKGLGRACALGLAREGADVAVCARDPAALEATAQEIRAEGVRAHAVAVDLSGPGGCESFVAEAVQAFGRLDVLVANNGGPPPSTAESADDAAWRTALEDNFLVTVRLARAAIPHMRANGWGRIVNITSYAVKQPIPGLALSNAARAAVAGFAKTLAAEVGTAGITVNTVAPGPFLTGRIQDLAQQRVENEGISFDDAVRQIGGEVPVGRVGDPDELGAVVAFLASERASFVTGTTIQVDGGVVRALL